MVRTLLVALAPCLLAACTLNAAGTGAGSGADAGAGGSGTTSAASGGGTGGTGAAGGGGTGSAGGGGVGGSGGCDAGCLCGNGAVDPGEECDDANATGNDGCTGCVVDCGGTLEVKDTTTFHCYRLVAQPQTWSIARAACIGLGPSWSFAALSTIPEVDLVATLTAAGQNVWIGGNDIGQEGTMVWDNGETWQYPNAIPPWKPAQPDNYMDEDCVQIADGNPTLNDRPCSDSFHYVCELKPLP